MERRALAAELRTKGRRLEGYAATFGVQTRILDFDEVIVPGAFTMSLSASKDVLALMDHDPRAVLARTKSGTLRLSQDTRGLAFDLDVPNTSAGRDILELAERGDIGGASVGFLPIDERWEGDRRELRAVDLKEISIVSAWPAYDQTVVHARSRPVLFPRVARALRYLDTV
jgi:HK97 family phage prohead protease